MDIYRDKTDNYVDMQVVSTCIYRLDMYVYLEWRSHLDIHGYAYPSTGSTEQETFKSDRSWTLKMGSGRDPSVRLKI